MWVRRPFFLTAIRLPVIGSKYILPFLYSSSNMSAWRLLFKFIFSAAVIRCPPPMSHLINLASELLRPLLANMSGRYSGSERSSDDTELVCRATGDSSLIDFFETAERLPSDLVVCFGSFSYGITTCVTVSNFVRLCYCVLLTLFWTYSFLYDCRVVDGRLLGYKLSILKPEFRTLVISYFLKTGKPFDHSSGDVPLPKLLNCVRCTLSNSLWFIWTLRSAFRSSDRLPNLLCTDLVLRKLFVRTYC